MAPCLPLLFLHQSIEDERGFDPKSLRYGDELDDIEAALTSFVFRDKGLRLVQTHGHVNLSQTSLPASLNQTFA